MSKEKSGYTYTQKKSASAGKNTSKHILTPNSHTTGGDAKNSTIGPKGN